MDIEHLKLILDLMQKAGEGGADLFVFYMLIENVPQMIAAGLFIGLLYYALICGLRMIKSNMAGERLRNAAGVHYKWEEMEVQAAEQCLRHHYKDFRAKTIS